MRSGDTVAVGWDARTPLRSVEPGMPPGPARPYDSFLDRFDAAYRSELNAFVAASKAVYQEFAKEVPSGQALIDKALSLSKGS